MNTGRVEDGGGGWTEEGKPPRNPAVVGKKGIVPNRSQRGVLIFDSWMMLRGRPFPTSSRDCLGPQQLDAVMSPGTITSVDSHGPLTGTDPPSNTKLFPKRYSVKLVQTNKQKKAFHQHARVGKFRGMTVAVIRSLAKEEKKWNRYSEPPVAKRFIILECSSSVLPLGRASD